MSKNPTKAILFDNKVLTENTDESRELYNKSVFGKILKNGTVQLSLIEALFLLETEKIQIFNKKNQIIPFDLFLKKAEKTEPNIWTKYCVFRDIRDRGYIIKTALKFGADFRVYEKGVKPGQDHAKWVIYPVQEGSILTWHDFAAKNRVAHSTKKRLLIGIVDEENDVTYYEIKWTRP